MTEPELLDRLRRGDQAAFESIFRRYYPTMVSVARAMLHDRSIAEEVGQEVMFELWRRRESLRVELSLRAYLIRATRNRALNHLRHERIARAAEPFAATETTHAPRADAELADHQINAAVRAAINELPPRCREVFELSRMHGLKYAEIAQVLNISIKTVEAQMGKALRTLRQRLAAWLPDADGI